MCTPVGCHHTFRLLLGSPHGQAPFGQVSRELPERVGSGGIGLERPDDERCPLSVDFDSPYLPRARVAYADTLDIAGDAGGSLGLSLTHRARLSLARAALTRFRINSLEPHKALEWATGADDQRLTDTERALAWQVKARAHAILGDYQAVARAVGMADEHRSQASPASDPPWVAVSGEAEYLGDTGHALADLAVANPATAGHVIREADRRLLNAAQHRDAHRRTRLFSRLVAAHLSMQYVDPSRAVEIASPAVQLAPFAPSAQAAVLAVHLQTTCEQHRHDGEVVWLQQQLESVTGSTAAEGLTR